jgi:hypothetical protein
MTIKAKMHKLIHKICPCVYTSDEPTAFVFTFYSHEGSSSFLQNGGTVRTHYATLYPTSNVTDKVQFHFHVGLEPPWGRTMAQAFGHRLLIARLDFAPRAVRVGFVVDCDGSPL